MFSKNKTNRHLSFCKVPKECTCYAKYWNELLKQDRENIKKEAFRNSTQPFGDNYRVVSLIDLDKILAEKDD